MKIQKSEGTTRTEKLLAKLAEETFLKLWSYPNPYKRDGKELCDLLAVFENSVFIFFDRESKKFNNSNKNVNLLWSRWHKEVIEKQIKTAIGAKNYILKKNLVYLDEKLENSFPLDLKDIEQVHLIIVAHEAHEASQKHFGTNTSGSLAIKYCEPEISPSLKPFSLTLNRNNPVHVLDSYSLDVIFSELDTISDFSEFIQKKEHAIINSIYLSYYGEEDLIAFYFENYDDTTNKYKIYKNGSSIDIPINKYKSFVLRPEYKKRVEENSKYRFWDDFIQYSSNFVLDGTAKSNHDIWCKKSPLHEMAKEPRFVRRELSKIIVDSINSFPDIDTPLSKRAICISSYTKNKIYVFLQVRCQNIIDYENEYRPRRRKLLEVACHIIFSRLDKIDKVVGIVIDAPNFSKRNSEDFIIINRADLDEETVEECNRLNRDLNFFNNTKFLRISPQEFPQL